MAQPQQAQAQLQPYEPLAKAPKELRNASRFGQVAEAIARITGILVSTYIIATLPSWLPGLLTLKPLPIILIVLTIATWSLAKRAHHIRELIGQQRLEKARSSSLTGSLLGFTVGGILPGPFYLLLYRSLGTAMVKKVPNETQLTPTTYLSPAPSNGMFLGRYLGWVSMYFLVLYSGYTQLPAGLRGLSDWLSPVFGVHFNTLIVAAYLVFSNPLTNPSILSLWMTVGAFGGMIAGGRTGRGFSVALTVFLSTLGAMGLAALSIFKNIYVSISSVNIPPVPTGFSITALANGPIAQDLVPVLLRPGVSPLDPSILQAALLILLRNAGLILAIVTISGRGGALAWQGGAYASRIVYRKLKGMEASKTNDETTKQATGGPSPLVKTGVLLLLLLTFPSFPLAPRSGNVGAVIEHAGSPAGPYQQYLSIGFDQLGSPNSSIGLANLDLSSLGLTIDSNYDQSNFTMLVINNNYPEGFGQGGSSIPLNLFSQPTLVTLYSSIDGSTAITRSNDVAAQFSHALNTTFTYSLSIPLGSDWASLYSTKPSLSNSEVLAKIFSILPPNSFASLMNPSKIKDQRFSALFGLIPGKIGNFPSARSFGFMLNIGFQRQFFKEGPHTFSMAGLLASNNNISGDPASNASIVTVNFEQGTQVFGYTPVSPNTYYNPQTWTLILNATASFSTPDLTANFSYPFAPDIEFSKTVDPPTGMVGTTHKVTLSMANLDSVPVNMVNLTDAQVGQVYHSTLGLSPDSLQTVQAVTLPAGSSLSTSYDLTTKSSGAYVLSPIRSEFVWTLPNGTSIKYSIETKGPTLISESGPIIQVRRAFDDLAPYSMLLLIPFLAPPIIEILGFFKRRSKKKREEERQGTQAAIDATR